MIPKQLIVSIRLIPAVVFLATANGETAEPARPTPRPGSLGAYAETVSLNRFALGDGTGRVILTNENVAGLAADGSITLGTVTPAMSKELGSAGTVDSSERARWQATHRRQRQVIANLERRRLQLVTEIDQIEDLGLTAKTMARLDRAEAKLRLLDEEIAGERAALARIVRDARQRGAEPGWFR